MSPAFPRLLVATEFPPNASGGGPAVVRQLLQDWPVSSLCWWSCFPDLDRRFGQQAAEHRWAAIPPKLYPRVRAGRLKSALMDSFWVPWAARHLRKTVELLRPDVLWLIPHDWSIPPLHAALRYILGDDVRSLRTRGAPHNGTPHVVPCSGAAMPFHVSLHDYVDVHTNPIRFGAMRCARMAQMADDLYARARTCDAICREMADDLQEHTGRAADAVIRFGVEPAELEALAAPSEAKTRTALRIGYAGTVLVEDVFEFFVNAVEKIHGSLRQSVELHLFGSHTYATRRWFRPEWMFEHGNLPEKKLREELGQCDWGFSPMSLADEDPRYNRFSFPTKFIAYLTAGLPIITLGHPQSSVMRMAARYQVGLASSSGDCDALAAQLKSVLDAPAPRERYRSEILRCAQTEFDAAAMRRTLYRCLGVKEGNREPPNAAETQP